MSSGDALVSLAENLFILHGCSAQAPARGNYSWRSALLPTMRIDRACCPARLQKSMQRNKKERVQTIL